MGRPALIATRSLSIACTVSFMFAMGSSLGAQRTRPPKVSRPPASPPTDEAKPPAPVALPLSPGVGSPEAGEYIGWAVGDVDVHPPQPRLECPAGSFIRSVSVTQDEWLARVGIFCMTPDQVNNPDPRVAMVSGTPGPETGGDGGSGAHTTMLTCSHGLVDGLTGLRTQVWRVGVLYKEYFAADPHLYCGSYAAPGASVIKDAQFRRSGDDAVSYIEMNTIYRTPEVQALFRCPNRYAASGIWYKLGGKKMDDIRAFGLICGRLPAPAGGAMMRRPG